VTGSVTFRIQTAPNSQRRFCYYFSDPGTPSWVSVRPAEDAGTLATQDPCPAVSACAACFCNGGFGYDALGDAGAMTAWDGTYYVNGTGACGRCGMCGQCFTEACALPGSYVATFCAYAQPSDAGGCGDTATTVCTETSFAWPPAAGAGPVLGVIGP
jgi:hypothetical protein